MFSPNLTKPQYLQLLETMPDVDFARHRYCQEIAGAYMAVAKFEDMLVNAMLMCDRVKVKQVVGSDVRKWYPEKLAVLQGSTLGSLIKILEKHDISSNDINYLKWIKEKRDFFIHRLFHQGGWPGDLDEDACRWMTRRLLATQLWLNRAERNIWSIFERAGFVELSHLEGGILVMNKDFLEHLGDDENGEAQEE